jgi:hypothetical protein
MPLAPKTLFGLRGALESVKGTDLTPTRILYPNDVKPKRGVESIVIKPLRNSFRPNRLVYPGMDVASVSVEGNVLYDEMSFWLSLAVKGGLTGSGGSADKTWAFTPSNAADDLKSATLQWGVPASATLWKLNYLMASALTLTYTKGEALAYAIDLVTPKAPADIGAFTGSLSDLTHVAALGTTTAVYIDSSTIGSTADANVVEAEFKLDNGLVVTNGLNATGTGIEVSRPNPVTWELKLTRLFQTNTERTAYYAKTERKVRVLCTGPSLGGTNYKLQLDCWGVIDNVEEADVDGVGAETITLIPVEDTAKDFEISLVNSLASIT